MATKTKNKKRRRNLPKPTLRKVSQGTTSTKNNRSTRKTPFQVIYAPIPGKHNPPIRFPAPPTVGNNRDVSLATQPISGTFIMPGRNNLSHQEWEYIQSLDAAQEYLDRRIIYTVYASEEPSEYGGLSDYAEKDALELVRFTYDDQELSVELSKERRTKVIKAIQAQQKFLAAERQNKRLKMVVQ